MNRDLSFNNSFNAQTQAEDASQTNLAPCALLISLPNQTAYAVVLWPMTCFSVLSFAYFYWGFLAALYMAPLVLVPWVRSELKKTAAVPATVLLAWWRTQVYLYIKGKLCASISLDSITGVRFLPGRPIKKGSLVCIPLPWYAVLLINTKSAVHIRTFGPLPAHLIRRIHGFSQALARKQQLHLDARTAPPLDSL